MSNAAELTYELLERLRAEFADFRRDMASVKMRLSPSPQNDGTRQNTTG